MLVLRGRIQWIKRKKTGEEELSLGVRRKVFHLKWRTIFCLLKTIALSHTLCAGRVMGIKAHVRDKLIKPPSYDPRDIVALVEKYGDACISDRGWRIVDPEEWHTDS